MGPAPDSHAAAHAVSTMSSTTVPGIGPPASTAMPVVPAPPPDPVADVSPAPVLPAPVLPALVTRVPAPVPAEVP